MTCFRGEGCRWEDRVMFWVSTPWSPLWLWPQSLWQVFAVFRQVLVIVSPHLPPSSRGARSWKAKTSWGIFTTVPLAPDPGFLPVRNSVQIRWVNKVLRVLVSLQATLCFLIGGGRCYKEVMSYRAFLASRTSADKILKSGQREGCVMGKLIFSSLSSELHDSQLPGPIWLKSSLTECHYSTLGNFTWPWIGF